ncbi:unnamed protein product [Pleuronectes platessa]|uniref:Uncharacterized protein n=1 Tax=Pleuronectes platessa TaxID=8262 RepID=A0A9N7TL57_PLEPL|nr:unnamed protein product [Pleuronectes platessa]
MGREGLWFISGSTPRRDNKRRTWIDLSKNPRISLPCLVPLSKAPYSPNICSPSAASPSPHRERETEAVCADVVVGLRRLGFKQRSMSQASSRKQELHPSVAAVKCDLCAESWSRGGQPVDKTTQRLPGFKSVLTAAPLQTSPSQSGDRGCAFDLPIKRFPGQAVVALVQPRVSLHQQLGRMKEEEEEEEEERGRDVEEGGERREASNGRFPPSLHVTCYVMIRMLLEMPRRAGSPWALCHPNVTLHRGGGKLRYLIHPPPPPQTSTHFPIFPFYLTTLHPLLLSFLCPPSLLSEYSHCAPLSASSPPLIQWLGSSSPSLNSTRPSYHLSSFTRPGMGMALLSREGGEMEEPGPGMGPACLGHSCEEQSGLSSSRGRRILAWLRWSRFGFEMWIGPLLYPHG